MAPRTYTLGKRAAQVAQTRDRILDPAAALFREQGIRATSMQEVARRADVAPATVLNHFPTPDLLTEAVLAHIAETLHVPSSRIFQGAFTVEERLGRLVPETFKFYDRSNQWFAMYQRERNIVQAIRAAVVAKIVEMFRGDEPSISSGDLGRISAPTLVMVGDDDLPSLEHTIALYRFIPNSELAVVQAQSRPAAAPGT